jgi:hypothetical protein
MKRGRYITWTPPKLAAVQPHLYVLEEGPRLQQAKQALIDAGFANDAEILTVHKLKTAQSKLEAPQQEAIAINHKQAAKKKTREKQRQSEGELTLRAQGERLSLKCHTWFFFLTVLPDVANIARVQERLYPGVGMNGVCREWRWPRARNRKTSVLTTLTTSRLTWTRTLTWATARRYCCRRASFRGRRASQARAAWCKLRLQSFMTESLSLQISREDAHCLVLSFTYKPKPLLFATALDEDTYRDMLEGLHVPVEAMTAAHEALTFEPKTSTITIRFSAKLGHQAEVRKFETTEMTIWLVPFEHVEGAAAPSVAKKRRVALEI